MAIDPARKIKREGQRFAVEQAGVTERAVQASLKKTTRQPKGIEVGYQAFLVSIQKQINAQIRKIMPELFSLLDVVRVDSGEVHVLRGSAMPALLKPNTSYVVHGAADLSKSRLCTQRQDALSDDVVAAFNSLRTFVTTLSTKTNGVLNIGVQSFGDKTAAFNDAKYNDPLMNLLGIGDVSANIEAGIVNGWVTENVQLVGNMNAQQLGKLETLFLRALRDGSRSAQVRGEVAQIVGVENINRARLIARDQIGKLDGQLTRQKQVEAGIQGYVWRGALDARERPSHVAREGVKFRWDSPPPDGHPGQAIQCRCTAEPDLSHLGEEFAPEPRSESDFSQTTPEAQAASRRQQARNRAGRGSRSRAPAAAR